MFAFFTFEEIEDYMKNNRSKYVVHDWNELKKRGHVEEQIIEKDGFVTITRTFVSRDKSEKITEVDSVLILDAYAQRLMEIDCDIKRAIEIEDYETAVKLRDEKRQILSK